LNSPLLAARDEFKGKLYSTLSAKQSGADVIPCSLLQGEFITLAGKKICLFGFVFKANTDDTRESPGIFIAKRLIEEKG
jgi:UDP-glucose 6-dehydrogenase